MATAPVMFGEYSPDEMLALVVGGIVALIFWIRWYTTLFVTGRKVCARGSRWPLTIAPLLSAAALILVLRLWSAEDVSSAPLYQLFYLALGAAWLAVFELILRWFGLNARDEVCERANDAAGWAISGALLGGTFCFAGGNVGNGPGWWVVLFAALLASATFFLLWALVQRASDLVETVIVERDSAAGLRAAGFFVGTGLILGGAVAGDWVSARDTMGDFVGAGWPALLLAGAVVGVEKGCRPCTDHSLTSLILTGWLPAAVYVGAGLVALLAVRP